MSFPESELTKEITIHQFENIPHERRLAAKHDDVAAEVKGGMYEDMPPGYYRSPAFLGTFTVSRHFLHYPSNHNPHSDYIP
jgi:hypothetical protein